MRTSTFFTFGTVEEITRGRKKKNRNRRHYRDQLFALPLNHSANFRIPASIGAVAFYFRSTATGWRALKKSGATGPNPGAPYLNSSAYWLDPLNAPTAIKNLPAGRLTPSCSIVPSFLIEEATLV